MVLLLYFLNLLYATLFCKEQGEKLTEQLVMVQGTRKGQLDCL